MQAYTQVPNWLLARIYNADDLTMRETKVFLYIIRKTYGFHKVSDKIPYGQISDATGIERRNVMKVVKSLEDKGYIYVRRKDKCINIMGVKKPSKGGVTTDTRGGVKNDNILVSPVTPSKENQKQPTSEFALLGEQTLVVNKLESDSDLGEINMNEDEKSYAELMEELGDEYE